MKYFPEKKFCKIFFPQATTQTRKPFIWKFNLSHFLGVNLALPKVPTSPLEVPISFFVGSQSRPFQCANIALSRLSTSTLLGCQIRPFQGANLFVFRVSTSPLLRWQPRPFPGRRPRPSQNANLASRGVNLGPDDGRIFITDGITRFPSGISGELAGVS